MNRGEDEKAATLDETTHALVNDIHAVGERVGFRKGLAAAFSIFAKECDERTGIRLGKVLLAIVDADDPIAAAEALTSGEGMKR